MLTYMATTKLIRQNMMSELTQSRSTKPDLGRYLQASLFPLLFGWPVEYKKIGLINCYTSIEKKTPLPPQQRFTI